MVGEFADSEDITGAGQVPVEIEADCGPWVAAFPDLTATDVLDQLAAVLCAQALSQPPVLATAYTATVAVIAALNAEIATLQGQVAARCGGPGC